MNNIIFMIGTTILTFFILLTIFPSYESYKDSNKRREDIDEEDFRFRVLIIVILLSIMFNSLVWGFIL